MKTKTIVASIVVAAVLIGAGIGAGIYVFYKSQIWRITFPIAHVTLPIQFANNAFKQDGNKDGSFVVEIDPATRRTSTSAPAIHIKGPIGAASANSSLFSAGNNRAFRNADNSSSILYYAGESSPLLGKHIQLTGWLKTSDVQNRANAFLLIFTKNVRNEGFCRVDSMDDRSIIGTTDWQQIKLVTDVPNEPCVIYFGPDLYGPGELWADDFQMALADSDTPATDDRIWRQTFSSPHLYSETTDFTTTHGGSPILCLAYAGNDTAPRGSWTWWGQKIRPSDVNKYKGHTLHMSGWVKTEDVSVRLQPSIRPWEGMQKPRIIAQDSMVRDHSLKGTLDSTQFSITCAIPKNTWHIDTSFIFWGSGKVWIDTNSLDFEIIN